MAGGAEDERRRRRGPDRAAAVICADCEGGPERCARDGHLRSWRLDEGGDPKAATFLCARCRAEFTVPRCACCGRVLVDDRAACEHPAPAAAG